MSQPAATGRMTPAEFLDWCLDQDERYELVDGRPQAMTGATRRHDVVVTNAIAFFRSRLRGGPCRPTTDDIAVRAWNANMRRPDVTVDCGPIDPSGMTSEQPVLVLEVLSPSTTRIDQFEKLEEYKRIDSLAYILFADTTRPHVVAYLRATDRSWSQLSHVGLDAIIALPQLGCELPLRELYEDVPIAAG